MSSSTSGEMADAPLSDDEDEDDEDLPPAADPAPAGARLGPRVLLSESALLSSVKLSIARLSEDRARKRKHESTSAR
jgi:hypothetical protein